MAGDICVVGQDADLEACQKIVEGTQLMTVYKPVEDEEIKKPEFVTYDGATVFFTDENNPKYVIKNLQLSREFYTGEKIYVCRNPHEKAMQRALLQYKLPQNYELVKEALLLCHREDLIGFDKNCLIPPRKIKGMTKKGSKK